MFDDAKNLKLLEAFELHWKENSKEVENTELSKADVRMWELKFEDQRLTLLESFSRHYYTNGVETRISRVKNQFDISVLKARTNYRENEKIGLKASSDFIKKIIDIIHKIVEKLS